MFSPSRVSVEVPYGCDAAPRDAMVLRRHLAASSGPRPRCRAPPRSCDLGALDVRRLFANIATAKKALRVQQGELTHVVVRRRSRRGGGVSIYVGNTFDESGYLATTVGGRHDRARTPFRAVTHPT